MANSSGSGSPVSDLQLPPEANSPGSSVSTTLRVILHFKTTMYMWIQPWYCFSQEEYDELLKYAVVLPGPSSQHILPSQTNSAIPGPSTSAGQGLAFLDRLSANPVLSSLRNDLESETARLEERTSALRTQWSQRWNCKSIFSFKYLLMYWS